MSDRAKLVQIYIAFYNRAPDPEGLAFWQSACDAGLSLEEIANLFVPQAESIATYPFLDTPTEDGIRTFLQDVYENLFNREPDAEGETFWTNQILQSLATEGSVDADGNAVDPSGLSVGEVLLSIICGAQGDDITALDNKTTVALDFHDQAAATPNYVQDTEAATASRLALGVVDETDFSVVQGEVLNGNFFEDIAPPVFTPFTPGNFSPLVPQGEVGLDEAPVNGFLLGNQIVSTVGVLSDGKVVTVYEIRGLGAVQMAVQLRNADGSLSGPDSFLLSEAEMAVGAVVTSPQVLALPDGGFIVLVRSFADAGADAALVAHRFDTFGVPVGEPVVVLDEGEIDIINSFNVAYQPTGNLIYTFAGDENFDGFSVDADTYVKVMTPDGETVVDTQVVNDNDATTTDEDESVVASLPDGTSLVVYETTDEAEDGDENAIIGQLYDVNGAAVGGPILINGFTARDQSDPAITALGDDRFLVTFQTFAQVLDPQSGGISAVILDRDGSIDVDEFLINASTAGNQSSPQVAELPNGNFVVVWSSAGDIHARIFEDDGSPVTVNDIVVNTLTTGSQSRPQVAVSQDGFVVTWDSNTPTIDDPFGFGTRMAAFDEGGMRVPLPDVPNPNVSVLMTEEFQVNNEVFAQQSDPGVVGLADGRSVFSYFDDESGGTLFEIRDANGLPLTADMVALQSDAMALQSLLPEARDVEMFATPDGGFVMVGTVRFNDTLGAGVRMQIFDSDLTPGDIMEVSIGGPVASNEGAEVTVGADGTIYVGWTFTSGGVSTMMLRTFAADGTPESGVTTTHGLQPNGGIDLDAISVSSDGNILLIGEGDNLAGASDSDLYMVMLTPTFVPMASGLLPVSTPGNQLGVTAAPLEDGNFLVAFGSNPAAPGDVGQGISGIIIDPNGQAVGGQFTVNTTTQFNQSTPDATVLSDGRVLVTWAGENPGFGQDIFGRIFDEDGLPDGDDFILNPLKAGNQLTPDVAAAGDGIALAWLSDPDFGGSIPADIKGAVFDEGFDPILTPLVVPDTAETVLSFSDLVDLQEGVLPGVLTLDGLIPGLASGGTLTPVGAGLLDYQDGGDLNLALGETGTELFGYSVTNGTDTVDVVGSFTLQGFEDYVI